MRFRSWLIAELSRTTQGTSSTHKAHIERRFSDALGHSRGRPYRGSTPGAKSMPASSLSDSGDLLLFLQPSSDVRQAAHVARDPEGRSAPGRRPAGDGFHRLATSGGEEVVSGPCYCTHLHCR